MTDVWLARMPPIKWHQASSVCRFQLLDKALVLDQIVKSLTDATDERTNWKFGRLRCKPGIASVAAPIEVPCSDRFEVEPLTDELHGFGRCRGAETEGALDEGRLTANVAGDVEDRRLTLAQRAHHLEAFDRRIGRLQRLEASDRADQLLQLAVIGLDQRC